MFIAFPFILISSSFGIKGGNVIYKICNVWARVWYFFVGVKHQEIYETEHEVNKQYIFVANHISYM
ncbi:MAG TPA: 1-acyl-sn-glycerol-3-phosphate acyltransferase, partial [Chitinophagaceae bacterium]|nr:1-acyl-sn-glycerol-3-phosphate acyltransferase [Chitinophagaceae bacterium]